MEIVATCVFLISPILNRTGSMVYAGRIHNTPEQGLWSMQEEYTIHNVYSFPSPSERCDPLYTVPFEHLCVVKCILHTALAS